MSYATVDQMIGWFGTNEMIHVTRRPGDAGDDPRTVNHAIVAAALLGAQEEMDSVLTSRYVLPMFLAPDEVPKQLEECQRWLAWCRLIAHSPRVTEEMQRECKRWRGWLADVRDRRVGINGLAERATVTPVYVSDSASCLPWGQY